MARSKFVLLQNQQPVAGFGDPINVENADNLEIGISGTATSFTVGFYGSFDGVDWYQISGTKESDQSSSATSNTIGDAFSLEVDRWSSVQARLLSVSGGYVTVKARAF